MSLVRLRHGAVIGWEAGVVTELDDTDEEPSHGGSILIRDILCRDKICNITRNIYTQYLLHN